MSLKLFSGFAVLKPGLAKHLWAAAITAALTCFLGIPSAAAQLYSDGGTNVPNNSWYIGGTGVVSDSFALAQSSTVQSFNFGLWVWSSETANYTNGTQTVNWSITSSPNGGTTYGSSTGTPLSGTLVFSNSGSVLYSESISTGNLLLAAGAYYLNLTGVTNNSGGVDEFWNESDGPSTAFHYGQTLGAQTTEITAGALSSYGSCATPGTSGDCSEQFSISGTVNSPGSPTPEPASIALLGSGLFGLAALRVRRSRAC